jgi:hypothetical protein
MRYTPTNLCCPECTCQAPDHRHRRLLRARRERPDGRGAADERDEIAAFQLI